MGASIEVTPNLQRLERRAVREAVTATIAPDVLRGDLPVENTVGTRLRRELESRYLTVAWVGKPRAACVRELRRTAYPWWIEDIRDRLIGESVLAALAHRGPKSGRRRLLTGCRLNEQLTMRGLELAGTFVQPRKYLNPEVRVHASLEFDGLVKRAISEELSTLLTQRELSVAQVARESGVDRGYLYQLCAGGRVPSLHTLFRLRGPFKLSAAGLMELIEQRMTGSRKRVVSLRLNSSSLTMGGSANSVESCSIESNSLDRTISLGHAHMLRAARRRLTGLSQERFAHESFIDRAYASRLERGLSQPSVPMAMQIAHQLGLHAASYVALVEFLIQVEVNLQNANCLLERHLKERELAATRSQAHGSGTA